MPIIVDRPSKPVPYLVKSLSTIFPVSRRISLAIRPGNMKATSRSAGTGEEIEGEKSGRDAERTGEGARAKGEFISRRTPPDNSTMRHLIAGANRNAGNRWFLCSAVAPLARARSRGSSVPRRTVTSLADGSRSMTMSLGRPANWPTLVSRWSLPSGFFCAIGMWEDGDWGRMD